LGHGVLGASINIYIYIYNIYNEIITKCSREGSKLMDGM